MIRYVAVILAGVLLAGPVRAQSAATSRRATTAPVAAAHEVSPAVKAFMSNIDVEQGDDGMRRKLKERHNTAVRLLQLRVEDYRKGLTDIGQIFETAKLAAQAKVDLARDARERRAVDEQVLEVSKAIETKLEQQWKAGITSEVDVLRARFARESAELELLKLEGSDHPPTTQSR